MTSHKFPTIPFAFVRWRAHMGEALQGGYANGL